MKTLSKFGMLLFLGAGLFSCTAENENLPQFESENAIMQFVGTMSSVDERNDNGELVRIRLSKEADAESRVVLRVYQPPSGGDFRTIPPMDENGMVIIDVPKGGKEGRIRVIPIDDQVILGHQNLRMEIVHTDGKLSQGSNTSFELTIIDDELIRNPKTQPSDKNHTSVSR
jgi:hypothetical protein